MAIQGIDVKTFLGFFNYFYKKRVV